MPRLAPLVSAVARRAAPELVVFALLSLAGTATSAALLMRLDETLRALSTAVERQGATLEALLSHVDAWR